MPIKFTKVTVADAHNAASFAVAVLLCVSSLAKSDEALAYFLRFSFAPQLNSTAM